RAGDELQERRLARTVAAHHAPPLAAADLEVEPAVDDARSVGLGDAAQDRDVLAESRRALELERHDLALHRRIEALDLLDLLGPALRLGRLRDVGAEAVD